MNSTYPTTQWRWLGALATCMALPALLAAKPTPSHLRSGQWGPASGGQGIYLSFKKDATYTREMQGPGGMTCSSRFEIRGGNVLLKQGKPAMNGSVTCPAVGCSLGKSRSNLRFYEYLKCGKFRYWNHNKKVPVGSRRKVGPVAVTTLGARSGTVLSTLSFRAGPSVKTTRILCTAESVPDNPRGSGRRKFLPKGLTLTVLARTVKTFTIGKRRGAWHYVELLEDEQFSCDKSRGWLFAPYVKLGRK